MDMTNEEIVRDYRQARSPKKHINVLADLNRTTPDRIIAVLTEAGVEVAKKTRRRASVTRKAKWDQDRARELLAEGKTIREIAGEVGASYSVVREWIKRTGLTYSDARKRRAAVEEKLADQASVPDAPSPAPAQQLESSTEDNQAGYQKIENFLESFFETFLESFQASLPKKMNENDRQVAIDFAAELFVEYLMARLGLR